MKKLLAIIAGFLFATAGFCQTQTHNPACPAGTLVYRTTRDVSGDLHDQECIDALTGQISWINLEITPGLNGSLKFADNSTQSVAAGTNSPVVVGKVDLIGQTAAIPNTTIYTSVNGGMYRISMFASSRGGAWTAGTVTLNVLSTWYGVSDTNTPGSISYSYPAGYYAQKEAVMQVDASTPIQYRVDFSGVTGTPNYDVHVRVEYLQ